MFTHILDNHYSFPNGFNFEKDTPITDANIASKAQYACPTWRCTCAH